MTPNRFDCLVRTGSSALSRRQSLRAFGVGLLALVTGAGPAAAACKTFNQTCNEGSDCCNGHGLRCKNGACRCRGHHAHCKAGPACQNLRRDPDHCGECGKQCPAGKPCCIDGKCRPKCGNSCCVNCFIELTQNGQVKPNSELCCVQDNGTLCRPKGGTKEDDRCCYPDEVCLKGACCSVGLYGTTNCGGECCSQAACCNGNHCCAAGKVCARKPGENHDSCVNPNRACDVDGDCFINETCHGGTCCDAPRMCAKEDGNTPWCCAANRYCEFNNTANATCTMIGQSASTYRGNRIRP